MTGVLTELVLVIGESTELSILAKSTAVLVLALVALRISRRAPASVRSLALASTFAILLVLPIAAAVMPPIALELDRSGLESEPVGLSAGIDGVRAGYAFLPSSDRSSNVATRHRPVTVRLLLRTAWAAGVALFLIPVLETILRLRRMRRGSVPWLDGQTLVRRLSRGAAFDRSVAVLLYDDLLVPVTYGVVRPAIVMPADAQHWTDAEVRRGVIHELEHVRRGDWPLHVLARIVCALYWFHPLVWVAWRRLCLESERACDDAVLRTAEAIAYAEQLVSLARRLSRRAPAPLLSMAARRDLTARVAAVLDGTQCRGRVGVLCGGVIVAIALVLVAGISPLRAMSATSAQPMGQAPTAASGRQAFEQASVTPHTPGKPRGIPPLMNGRFTAGEMTLKELIRIAYGLPALLSSQVVGGAAWVDSDRFDIEAQVPGDMTFGASWHPRVRAMLKTLLSERFKLQLSRETRELPAADLMLANRSRKLGAGLRPAAGDCVDLLNSPSPPAEAVKPACGITQVAPGLLAGKKVTMALLAGLLSQRPEVDRVVRDRTGLDGAFDFRVDYAADSAPSPGASSTSGANSSPISPALLAALETQLGLRLESHQGPVEVLVIRHAEKPTDK